MPQPTEKTDLRVLKTHKYIRQALVDLLDEKNFREITIHDLLEKAMINRTTFYRYYSGKSDLAGKMIAEFKQFFSERMEERLQTQDLESFYQNVIPLMFERRRELLALWKIDTAQHHLYLYRDMRDMAKTFVGLLLKQAQRETPYTDYQATVFSVMMLESVRYHFEHNRQIDPKIALQKIREVLEILDY